MKLDNEAAFDLNLEEGSARVDPPVEPNELRWSLSHWRDLRQPAHHNQSAAEQQPQLADDPGAVPAEIATLQSLFPGFYASVPEDQLS